MEGSSFFNFEAVIVCVSTMKKRRIKTFLSEIRPSATSCIWPVLLAPPVEYMNVATLLSGLNVSCLTKKESCLHIIYKYIDSLTKMIFHTIHIMESWKLHVWNKVTTRWEGPQSLSYHKQSLGTGKRWAYVCTLMFNQILTSNQSYGDLPPLCVGPL